MTKRKRTNEQTTIYKTLHRKTKYRPTRTPRKLIIHAVNVASYQIESTVACVFVTCRRHQWTYEDVIIKYRTAQQYAWWFTFRRKSYKISEILWIVICIIITCFTLTKLIHLMINCNSIYVFVFCVLLLLHGIEVELHWKQKWRSVFVIYDADKIISEIL
jgi:hypothetical protein